MGSAITIPMNFQSSSLGVYVYHDWVHHKGMGANIWLDVQPVGDAITASVNGAICWETLGIYATGDDTRSFSKNKFKDVVLWADGEFYFDLTDCEFEGLVYFKGNRPSLINCAGAMVYCDNTPIVSGTNLIKYITPTTINLGTQILKDNGIALETHSLSASNNISATSININAISLSANGNILSTGAGFTFNNTGTLNGDLNINSKINSTIKAPSTISLSAQTISLTGAIHIDQIPTANQVEFVGGDGITYLINVTPK
jgi:hypothetical protein